MAIARLYTGDDGKSHFEDLDPKFDPSSGAAAGIFPESASGITYRSQASGTFIDFHTAPRRQWLITLSGTVEIVTEDGTTRRFGTGDAMLAEDTTGRGHTTRIVSSEPRVTIVIPVP
jgi:hypothetical protein